MVSSVIAAQQSILIDGRRVVCYTAGDPLAPPVLMIHGLLSHAQIWRQTFDALSDRYFCVAPDLLGLGASDKPPEADYSVPAQAGRVLALADALGLGRFTLLGHSMGAQIALYLAAQIAPERVARLVDVGGVVTGRLGPALERFQLPLFWLGHWVPPIWGLARFLLRSPRITRLQFAVWFHRMPSDMESWAIDRRMALAPGVHSSAWRLARAIQSLDLTPLLARVSAPALVLFGRQDRVVPVEQGALAHERLPRSRLVLIDECGHYPMLEQPGQYLQALQAFLAASGDPDAGDGGAFGGARVRVPAAYDCSYGGSDV